MKDRTSGTEPCLHGKEAPPPGHPAVPRLILYPGAEGGELVHLVWEQSHRGKTHTY